MAEKAGEAVGRGQGEDLQIPNRKARSREGKPQRLAFGRALASWRVSTANSLRV